MTNLKRFYLGNGRFCFMRPFCAVLPRIVFQTFRSKNCSVFPKNLPDLSLRGGGIFCARRGNLKRNDLSSRNEIWLDGTKQNPERKRKRNEAANLMFFVIGLPSCFPLPCFATGCHTFGLKIATAALRPRNDKFKTFLFGKRTFLLYAAFLRGVAPHRFSNVSFQKLFRFSEKPTRFVIARRGHFLRPTRQS